MKQTTESIVRDDEQVLTTNAVSSEQINTENKEAITQVKFITETSVCNAL